MGTTGQSITLANSIIGVGILAMPFCFQQCGVVLATLILLFMGLISRLCCYFLLKSALLARRRNFEFLAFHVFGLAGKMAVEVGIIGFLMGTCIAYFVVVGDLGPQIIAKMFNINQSDILRTSIMVIVSLVCVLPLGLLRNVDSLSNVSAATIGFYFCLVMKVITEAASQLMTSDWHRRVEMWRPAGLLQCVPIFSMALFCQTQLFEIFEFLPTLSLEKMNVVTKNAINICTGVYFTLGVFGYIAFCSQDISGNILMSLSPTMASDVIKLGFVMSLAFSFPLIIFPCRASLYSFLYKKVHSSHHDHIINHSIPETTFRCITVAIIAVALFISLLIPNIELVLGLLGSTIGVLVCVVFPAACFVNVTFKNTNERLLAKGIVVLGLIILVLGTYANLEAAGENKVDRYDEKYTKENIDKIVQDFFEKRNKDDPLLKPENTEPLSVQPHKNNVLNEIIKDSEAQPPNPVPPESHSNEKTPEIKVVKPIEQKIEKPVNDVQDTMDKISVTHPKNLNKLDTKINGISKTEAEKPKEIKTQSNEDKIDIIKQQKLIETIKQHGEEQKELMKEQKEILDEIIKTKKEIEQNKNEADKNEAKKIAVESIKQIANMAIQSIGGVSEKPNQVNEKADRLEKLTNEAVQEIAKKAVETIEAIQVIKENPDPKNVVETIKDNQELLKSNVDKVQNGVPLQVNNGKDPAQSIQTAELNKDQPVAEIIQPEATGLNKKDPRSIQANPNKLENIQPNVALQNIELPVPQETQAQTEAQKMKPVNVPTANKVQSVQASEVKPRNPPIGENINDKKVETQPMAVNVKNAVPIVSKFNIHDKAKEIVAQKPNENKPLEIKNDDKHSHSPDEPQSYKQGEDTQVKNIEVKIPQNVPLPIAINDLLSSKQIQEKEAVAAQLNEDINKENVPLNKEPIVVRQKREVVDCTRKSALEPKDREICDTLIDQPKVKQVDQSKVDYGKVKEIDVIPPVDLNDLTLPKSLPMDTNILHHIGRSLKSFDEEKR